MAVLLQAPPTSLRAPASAPVFDALMHGPTANPAVIQRHAAFAFSSPWPRRATNESWLPAADQHVSVPRWLRRAMTRSPTLTPSERQRARSTASH